jgi:N-acetylmuramoyl-L-alanine amidase
VRHKRWVLGLSLAILVAGSAWARAPERFDTVVIDAGHGGDDRGARGPRGTYEKDAVLAVARDLAGRLRGRGLQVVMTREDDRHVPLERRNAIANDSRGDLFISVHANAAQEPHVRGTETYFLALDASDASAAEVAQRENRAFRDAPEADIEAMDDPFIALLGDMIATEAMAESSEAARLVQTQLQGIDGLRSRGVKQAMFVVLSGVPMPAVLVEVGFITNPQDERTLAEDDGRAKIVRALERAVVSFGERYDARRGNGPASGR